MSSGTKIGLVVALILIAGFVIWTVQQPRDVVRKLPDTVRAPGPTALDDKPSLAADKHRVGGKRTRERVAARRPTAKSGAVTPPARRTKSAATAQPKAGPALPSPSAAPEPAAAVGPGATAPPAGASPKPGAQTGAPKPAVAVSPGQSGKVAESPAVALATPGTRLERPARRPTPAGPATRKHTIQPGDRLIDLARDYYGDESLWRAIKQANPGLDETRLQIGQTIVIPSEAEARLLVRSAAETPQRSATTAGSATPTSGDVLVYIVERGDTLIGIARKVLKDESRWREIYELNRDVLESPDVLLVGMKLKLPGGGKQP